MTVSKEYADELESENDALRQEVKRRAIDDALTQAGAEVEGKRREVVYNELSGRLRVQKRDDGTPRVVGLTEDGDVMTTRGGEVAGAGDVVADALSGDLASVVDTGESEEDREQRLNRDLSSPMPRSGTTDKDERARELNGRTRKPWR